MLERTLPEFYWQLGEGELEGVSPDDVYVRLMVATDTASFGELAAWLGVSPESVRLIKECGMVPMPWLRQLSRKKSPYLPKWVLTGKGFPFYWPVSRSEE